MRALENYFRKAIEYFFRIYISLSSRKCCFRRFYKLTDQVEERCRSLKNKGRDQLFFQYVPTSECNDVLVKKTLLNHFSRVNALISDKVLRLTISRSSLPLADYTLTLGTFSTAESVGFRVELRQLVGLLPVNSVHKHTQKKSEI